MEKFEITFSQLWNETIRADEAFQMDLKRVENLQLDPRSDGFGTLVTSVFRQFEVLEDVLSEIEESRVYEGEDLKALEKLKEKFSYDNYMKFEEIVKEIKEKGYYEL